MTKKGNQQRRKAPTTIPSVFAAFFWRLNLNILADNPVLVDVPAAVVTAVAGVVDEVVVDPVEDVRLEPFRGWCTLLAARCDAPKLFFIIAPVASSRSLASSLSSGGGDGNGSCC